jgi:hypothetical protein
VYYKVSGNPVLNQNHWVRGIDQVDTAFEFKAAHAYFIWADTNGVWRKWND